MLSGTRTGQCAGSLTSVVAESSGMETWSAGGDASMKIILEVKIFYDDISTIIDRQVKTTQCVSAMT